jgi:hypothetical protein
MRIVSFHAPDLERNTAMSQSTAQDTLFESAQPFGLHRRLGLIRPGNLCIRRRALIVVLVGWMPLVALVLAQAALSRPEDIPSLLSETGVHARYLIAAPLLVLAEAACAPRLTAIAHQFGTAGLISERDRGRVEIAVASTRELLESNAAGAAVIVLAYLTVALAVLSHPSEDIPAWHHSAGAFVFSPAGWWHVLVSMPLLLILIFGWLWRLALWARLLRLVARLDLRLVASHPDHAAGLAFVGHSVRAFAVVALALATIAAGRSAHFVLQGGTLPTPQIYFNAGYLTFVLLLFILPLLVLVPTLLRTWQRGVLEYGALASGIGGGFEHKWFAQDRKVGERDLDRPDFSAANDLYGVTSNVYGMRVVPLGLKDVVAIIAALLLPFVPVVLLAVPADAIWKSLTGLLL